MSDMISRKAVYDALECMRFASDAERRYGFSMVEQIPTAEPDHFAEVSKKGDLISRADAIDAISKIKRTDNWQAAVSMVLLDLPSTRHNVHDFPKDADCISRADALSCFHDWIDSHGDVHTADEMSEYQRIEQLPSVQPEIIQCKDCKHFIRDITCVEGHYNGCDAWTDNGNEIEVAEDDFCSYAERRTDG